MSDRIRAGLPSPVSQTWGQSLELDQPQHWAELKEGECQGACLAVGRVHDSGSRGCKFEPRVGCRDNIKSLKRKEAKSHLSLPNGGYS